MHHTHSACAGAPFLCGSVLVFIALIVGLCIRQGEVHQSEAGSRLQEPLLGECPARTDGRSESQQHAMSAELMDVRRPVACVVAYTGMLESLGHVGKAGFASLQQSPQGMHCCQQSAVDMLTGKVTSLCAIGCRSRGKARRRRGERPD